MKTIILCVALSCISGCDWIQTKKNSEEPKKEHMGIELKLEPK